MRPIPLKLAAGLLLAGIAATAGLAARQDGWSEPELTLVRSLSLDALGPLPPDPSNRVADDPAAASLGRALFFDTRFSANGEVACATCHLPERQFQDDRPLAAGVGITGRRSMPIAGMARAPFLFWDGRADSLWAQALGPLESAVEHGGDRTQYARLVAQFYAGDYESVFGPLPDLAGLPPHAGPVADAAVAAAWEALDPDRRAAVDTVFTNIGKAIAAFERTITPAESRFDRWVRSDSFPAAGLLDPDEIAGLQLFIGAAECVNCHNGPLFTDNHFHNTGVPPVAGRVPDHGRASGALTVRSDPFNCLGPYSDAAPTDCAELRFMAEPGHDAVGAFKTPSLRGVTARPPYMHAGQIGSIDAVLAHYVAAPEAAIGHTELRPLQLGEAEIAQLTAFLSTLEAAPAEGDPDD